MSNSRQMSSDADVSRLMSEEQIIDTVFQTCDVCHTGWVQVSRLVDCVAGLSQHSTTHVENDKLKLLVDLLDPSGTNPKISMISYRSGISRWIKMLRLNEYLDEESELSGAAGSHDDVSPKSAVHSAGLFPMSSSSCELSNVNDEYDTIELKNRLEYIDQQNRRFGDELSDLREQLNLADDTVAQLKQENCQLKHTLKWREYEDLKLTLDGCIEEKKQLQAKLTKVEQANKNLSENVTSVQKQLSSAQLEIESTEEEILNLHQQLNDKTMKLLSLEKTLDEFQLQLASKNSTVEELDRKVSALADINKNLMKHSSEIETQLAEKKQLLHLQAVELSKKQLCDCLDQEIENDIDLMPFVPRHLLSPPRQSTPQFRNVVSLQKELTSKIAKEPVFPSPLCNKELESLFHRSDENLSIITKDATDGSYLAEFCDFTKLNTDLSPIKMTPTSTASKHSRKVNNNDYLDVTRMRDSLTREVESIAEMAICHNMQRYKQTLADFVDRIAACTDARIAAEQRNVALLTTLRVMQERMEEQGIIHHLALQELKNQQKSTTADFESCLKQKNFMIHLEMQRNKDLELMIVSLENDRLNNAKTNPEGENRVRIRGSTIKDDHPMTPLCHLDNNSRFQQRPGNRTVEQNVGDRLRDNAERSEAMLKLLVEAFRQYVKCKHSPSVEPSQLVNATDGDDKTKERAPMQGQGDSQRTDVITLQVSRFSSFLHQFEHFVHPVRSSAEHFIQFLHQTSTSITPQHRLWHFRLPVLMNLPALSSQRLDLDDGTAV